jgi:predicted nucleic acid-binding Zn ribbon protein
MIYVYETTNPDKPLRRFEVSQSMKDEPLRTDPKTGEPVRRVITGGSGVMVPGSAAAPKAPGSCGPGCGCH